jgi:S-adenosylmethionine hydrolase
VAPDNGLLSLLARGAKPDKIVRLMEPQYFLPRISATFHGRDIIAPAAAHLSLGVELERLGPDVGELVRIDWPEPACGKCRVDGQILCADSFGNLITNITEDLLQPAPRDISVRITCDEHETVGIFETYAQQPEGTLLALIGSSGRLELAIVGDSAREILSVGPGAPMSVEW